MRKRFATAAILVGILGCQSHPSAGGSAQTPSPMPDAESVAHDYSHLVLMTKAPVRTDPAISAACAAATPLRKPTTQPTMRVFMTDAAAGAFRSKSASYPVGSVVVKEKGSASDPANVAEHRGVGGMIKRPAGYDSKYGDWEYFYLADDGKVTHGRMESCVGCHVAARPDHVFEWAGSDQPSSGVAASRTEAR